MGRLAMKHELYRNNVTSGGWEATGARHLGLACGGGHEVWSCVLCVQKF